MAISFVAGSSGTAGSSGEALSVNLPTGTTTDDFVFVISASDGGFLTDEGRPTTAGYNELAYVTDGNPSYWVGWKIMGATPDTEVTVRGAGGASECNVSICTFRGVNTSNPIGVAMAVAGAVSGQPDPPSITLSTDQMSVCWGAIEDDVVSSVTAPTDWGNLEWFHQGAANACQTTMIASRLIATGGAYNPGIFTTGVNDNWDAGHVGLAPASAGIEIAADAGTYSISGAAANLEVGRLIGANSGAYNISGADASLIKGIGLIADAGSYIISGQDVSFAKMYLLAADGASYSINGSDANLTLLRVLTIDAASGAYLINGDEVGLEVAGGGGGFADGAWLLRRRRL